MILKHLIVTILDTTAESSTQTIVHSYQQNQTNKEAVERQGAAVFMSWQRDRDRQKVREILRYMSVETQENQEYAERAKRNTSLHTLSLRCIFQYFKYTNPVLLSRLPSSGTLEEHSGRVHSNQDSNVYHGINVTRQNDALLIWWVETIPGKSKLSKWEHHWWYGSV